MLVLSFIFLGSFVNVNFFYSELEELQQTYQVLVLDMQSVIKSNLHLPQPSLLMMLLLQQITP